MKNLVQAVKDKVRTGSAQHAPETQENLTADKKRALLEAERLADLYEDVKPKQSRISSGRLFILPSDG